MSAGRERTASCAAANGHFSTAFVGTRLALSLRVQRLVGVTMLMALGCGAPGESARTVGLEGALQRARARSGAPSSGPADSRGAPDYYAEVSGVTLGPFSFPGLPVLVHDYLDQLPGVGLAGMGLLQHLRVAFDVRQDRLYASPGKSYPALCTDAATAAHAGDDA